MDQVVQYNADSLNFNPYVKWGTAVALLGLLSSQPALAQAWASKTNSVLEQVISGLKMLGRGIAICCLVWSAYQIW
ncbi:TrbC/VirB2 family protein [Suttonella ornithocola]|uniref:TrbC/VirB2 family protein n=1 Tax=Suttonella ornithocola TaxID=279832 RepID=UPI003CCC4C7A